MAEMSPPPGPPGAALPKDLLLATKLTIPPARPNLVARPHLIDRLNQGLDSRLILVSAPPGYGKTTLLSEWIHSRTQRVEYARRNTGLSNAALSTLAFSWLSLDENDNDPARFLAYLAAALHQVYDTWGRGAQALLQAREMPPLTTLMAALINEIASGGPPIVLVLDDYHLIAGSAIHELLEFAIEHMPSQMHLAILTRADPPFSLARLRARGQLCEIRETDLRFTDEEASAFLDRAMDLELAAEDVAGLQARAEGWVAGLQIAGLALRGLAPRGTLAAQDRQPVSDFIRSFSGNYRYVLDYLAEEVLGRQPDAAQRFLLQTSILDRMCGDLCDAVIEPVPGAQRGEAMLESLERANVFIAPLDNERRWYRYHPLFADLLRARLRQLHPDQVPALQRRASLWHEQHGLLDEAIGYALAARDVEHAAVLLQRHVLPVLHRGEVTLVRHWLDALPEELCRSRPVLCVACAWSALLAPLPDKERAAQWLRDAEEGLQKERPGSKEAAAEVAMLRPVVAFERGADPRTVVEGSHQALADLPADKLQERSALLLTLGEADLALGELDHADASLTEAARAGEAGGSPFVAFMATYLQATIARERGQLHRAAALCRAFLRTVANPATREGRLLPGTEAIHIVLGSILLEWNQLVEAEQALHAGFGQVQAGLSWHWVGEVEGYAWMSRLRQAQGDRAGALALIEQAQRAPRSPVAPAFSRCFDAQRVRLWLAQADDAPERLADAARWVREQRITLETEDQMETILPLFTREWCRLVLARLLISQCRGTPPSSVRPDLGPLLRALDEQIARAGQEGWTTRAIEALVLRALALQALGQVPPALASLERALDMAEPEGYVRTFIDEGPAMLDLLATFRHRQRREDRLRDYAKDLIDAFGGPGGASAAIPPRLAGQPVEPLSPREVEVLRLIAAGLSNQEIAQELVVAVGTVKAHTSSIYRKLDARGRAQAIVRARELDLI